MPEISVEYEVLVGVKVDTDTGEVTNVVLYGEDFTSVTPFQIYGQLREEDVPSYLNPEEERVKDAVAIANEVYLHPGYKELTFRVAP